MLKFIKALEERFQRGVSGPGADEPLLLRQEIARAARNKVTAQGRGQRIFPFNLLQVEIVAADEEQAIMLEESFRQGRPLEEDVLAALRQEDCRAPEDLRVEVQVWRELPPEWAGRDSLAIRFSRRAQAVAPGRLTVLTGQAVQKSYSLQAGLTYLGRCREVLDENKSLLRVNDIAFDDDAGKINASVSRLHATITYDERRRAYILRDNGSSYGTSLLRGNQKMTVDAQAGRILQDKDVIYLGRAKLQLRLDDTA